MVRLADVSARMSVRRGVAAADVAAAATDAEMDPRPADLQAVLATGDVISVGDLDGDLVEMRAGGHRD